MDERWLPVVGYEGIYDVSDHGRVRRMKAYNNTWIGKVLKSVVGKNGYVQVGLCNGFNQRTHKIHQLATEAFFGECPDDKEVNHIDGDKTNNHIGNLEYVSHRENVLHACRNGLSASARGEQQGNVKLTEENVHEIRTLLGKKSQNVIARLFNVSQPTISDISTGKNWGWLDAS